MAGIILASSISGSLDAKNIVMEVLTQALDIAKALLLGRDRHVREEVKGCVRLEAMHSGDAVQGIGGSVAPLSERCHNLPWSALIAREPLQGTVLDEMIRA